MMHLSPDPIWGWEAIASLDAGRMALQAYEQERLRTRPGEVALVLETSDGKVWLHTKDFYPSGVYRLPTGSLKGGELPDDAYTRELAEETGIRPAREVHRVARIRYRLDGEEEPFMSYLYAVHHVDETPRPLDAGERITDWRAIPRSGLAEVAAKLRQLQPE